MSVILPLYGAATTLGVPALRLMLARRLRQGRELADRLPERWGEDPTPRPPGQLVWLHAASVGETICIMPAIPPAMPIAALMEALGTMVWSIE